MGAIDRNIFKILILGLTSLVISRCTHQPDICDTNNYAIDYNIHGQLVEDFTSKPLKNQLIKLHGSGPFITTEMAEVLTDDSGYFSFGGTAHCPSPVPDYFQIDGNNWRCTDRFYANNFSDTLFSVSPIAYIMINLHRVDSNVAFDSLVVSTACCCGLSGVKMLSYTGNANDTVFIKPIGGAQKENIVWNKYGNNLVIAHDTSQIDIPGIDTVETTINF